MLYNNILKRKNHYPFLSSNGIGNGSYHLRVLDKTKKPHIRNKKFPSGALYLKWS